MSQTKFPVLKIRSKDLSKPPMGANIEATLDGVPLNTASFIKIECHARRVTKVLVEMYAHVELDVMGDLTSKVIDLVPKDNTK